MCAAPDNAIFIDLNFIGVTEGHKFFLILNGEAGKLVASSFRPLKINLAKARIHFCGFHIFLEGLHGSANSSIDTVRRNDDSTFNSQ